MTTQQPEALLLADVLDGDDGFDNRVADEQRRLHEANQELLEALKKITEKLESMNHEDSIFAGEFDDEIGAAHAAIAKLKEKNT